eukprot:1119-Chlamydomonas_euryale.AAC.1
MHICRAVSPPYLFMSSPYLFMSPPYLFMSPPYLFMSPPYFFVSMQRLPRSRRLCGPPAAHGSFQAAFFENISHVAPRGVPDWCPAGLDCMQAS